MDDFSIWAPERTGQEAASAWFQPRAVEINDNDRVIKRAVGRKKKASGVKIDAGEGLLDLSSATSSNDQGGNAKEPLPLNREFPDTFRVASRPRTRAPPGLTGPVMILGEQKALLVEIPTQAGGGKGRRWGGPAVHPVEPALCSCERRSLGGPSATVASQPTLEKGFHVPGRSSGAIAVMLGWGAPRSPSACGVPDSDMPSSGHALKLKGFRGSPTGFHGTRVFIILPQRLSFSSPYVTEPEEIRRERVLQACESPERALPRRYPGGHCSHPPCSSGSSPAQDWRTPAINHPPVLSGPMTSRRPESGRIAVPERAGPGRPPEGQTRRAGSPCLPCTEADQERKKRGKWDGEDLEEHPHLPPPQEDKQEVRARQNAVLCK
ncbi:hypothetical protein CB1_000299018 [Camelus ferus]|nr:hypothetical protein CB1_000299018 [Camelus ferus]